MELSSFIRLLPEAILCFGAFLILLFDIALPKYKKFWFGIGAYAIVLISFLSLMLTSPGKTDKWLIFQDTYGVDGFSIFLKALLLLAGSIVILFSLTYVYKGIEYKTEYFSLLLFSIMSMLVLVSSTDLILIILAFEFIGITSYILVGYKRDDIKSKEASLKYFFFGAVSAAVLLMGFSILYGITGKTAIYGIAEAFKNNTVLIPNYSWMGLLALVMVGAGFGFKIAMVPFQMWVPDVYEGAPTPITAFLSVASKCAGIAILLRFFFTVFKVQNFAIDWSIILVAISILTMFMGNLMAISQNNIKRMLGYSSIAHVGYILAGMVAIYNSSISDKGIDVSPILIYLVAYVYMNLGAFSVIIMAEDMTGDEIPNYAGLSQRAPILAGMLTIFMLSLAGLPPLAGFIGKFFVFGEIVNATYYYLAIIAVLNSVISVYYYFKVVHFMYFMPPAAEEKKQSYSLLALAALYVCFAGTLVMGIAPNWIIELARKALMRF